MIEAVSKDKCLPEILALFPDLVAHRHDIHQHPDCGFETQRTIGKIKEFLEKHNVSPKDMDDASCPGSLFVEIKGNLPGKTIGFRADIDALKMKDKSEKEWSSKIEGHAHACGHDCHAAMLLGAARLLWESREELAGTVKLLFQAAEEVFVGSHYYVDKGYLDDVDAAMGLHVWPTASSGRLVVMDGPLMASCDNYKITVHGVSAHGSAPNQGKDAIVAASAIITNLQTIVSRVNDPLNSLVVTVGTVRAGTQFNIITDTAVLEGTVRAHTVEARGMVEQAMHQIVDYTAMAHGCTAEIEYKYLEPPVCNSCLLYTSPSPRDS